MRKLTFIASLIFLFHTSFAQTEDNVTLVRVQKEMGNGNYRAAIEQLNKISSEGKKSDFYLSFKATCYENLYKFDSAAVLYRQLYKRNNSMDVLKKIADMDEFGENKKKYLWSADSLKQLKGFQNQDQIKFNRKQLGDNFVAVISDYNIDNANQSAILLFKLPSFELKSFLITGNKSFNMDNSRNENVYSYRGIYYLHFSGELSPCNKDLPSVVCIMTVDKFYNKIEFFTDNYQCDNIGGEYKATKTTNPSYWEFYQISKFYLND